MDVLELGYRCGLHQIERLMKAQALRARPKCRAKPTDRGNRSEVTIGGNLLDRQFAADAPNKKWVADFTYIWTAEGWLYVAAVLDLNRYQYPRHPPASRSTAVQTLPETGHCCCRGA